MSFIAEQPLLIFRLISQRQQGRLLASWLVLLLFLVLDQFISILGNYWLFFWLCWGGIFALWCYVMFWVPHSIVRIKANQLVICTPTRQFPVGFNHILTIRATQLEQHFPIDELPFSEFELLTPIYKGVCVWVILDSYPPLLSKRKQSLPRFLFTPSQPGLLLAVQDPFALNQALTKAYNSWQQQNQVKASKDAETVSTFTQTSIPLPATSATNHSPLTTINKPIPITNLKSLPLILIAEDNLHLAQQLQTILEQHYRVVVVQDGVEALHQIQHLQPELVISDLHMPNMDGYSLLWAIRSDPEIESTPVIILTASDEHDFRIKLLEAGANDYLIKPCSHLELLARVRNLLRGRSQERELMELNHRLEARVEEQLAELVISGDLKRFLPASVADSVLAGQIGPTEEFKRRVVTILFVDIVSFTALTEKLQPYKLAALLNEYLREMTAVTLIHGGVVDKFIGDALMVLFGAPNQIEPAVQAWSAIQTGMAMMQQTEALAQRWRRTLPFRLQARIGINTGECTIGVFGSDLLKTYTAIGGPVNIASRLQGEATPQTILCGTGTHRLVAERVRASSRGYLQLRGIREPVEAYDILEMVG